MTEADVMRRTRAYILENFLYMRPDFPLADDDRLLEKGIIDSMGVMELIEFLESEFQVSVDEREVTEENFATLRDIGRYVASKGAAGA